MSIRLSRESLESVFKQLLVHSRELEKAVLQEESDPEQWLELLEKREELLQQISDAIGEGTVLPAEWKQQYVEPFLEIDQRLIPIMKGKQDQLSGKIAQIKRGRTVNKQYGGYGTTAYGAFFDKKK